MAIDTKEEFSPGWWLKRLFGKLGDRQRRIRLQTLHNYMRGRAPLPEGAENAREAFSMFQRKARSNFAKLVVSAMSARMIPTGFRTALDNDATGDAEVGAMWARAGLPVTAADVHNKMLGLGESFVIVGAMDPDIAAPVITCEDPRFMVAEKDPANPRKVVAALKVVRDDARKQDRAYLYLPGKVYVAVRKGGTAASSVVIATGMEYNSLPEGMPALPAFSETAWTFDDDREITLDHGKIPVVHFENEDGMGEFEAHTDVLDRINHQILQRMVISTMQAFRQRAIKGLPKFYPDGHEMAGQEINYEGIFTADPAAIWNLPIGAELWESAINDLTPLLGAVKADVEHLGSVTQTPMFLLLPDGVNQSAEGASLAREGLVFKVEDRIARSSFPWAQVMCLALLAAGQPERADIGKLQTMWAPAQRLSLLERADATSKMGPYLPRRTLLITVIGMTPAEADRTMTEFADDQILAAQIQQAMAISAQQQAPLSVPAIASGPAVPVPNPAISAVPADSGGEVVT